MNESANNNHADNSDLTEERRRFVRLDINVQIDYSVIPDDQQQTTQSRNISAGGICMIVEQKLAAGSMVQLDITLPEDPPPVVAKGKVMWVKSFSMEGETSPRFDTGIEFIDLDETSRKRIAKYVFSLR